MNGIILTAVYFSVKFRHIWLCHILPGFQRIMMCYVTIVISYTIATIHVFDQWDTVQKLWPWAANFHQPQTSSQIGPKRSQRARIWCHSSRTETEAMASALKKSQKIYWRLSASAGIRRNPSCRRRLEKSRASFVAQLELPKQDNNTLVTALKQAEPTCWVAGGKVIHPSGHRGHPEDSGGKEAGVGGERASWSPSWKILRAR